MHIPTDDDWQRDPNDLDAQCAYEHSYGRSLEEAVSLFAENSIFYQEDILFMPSGAFRFYVHAYMDYLLSDASQWDSDGASCFIALVDYKAEHWPEDIESAWQKIEQTLRRLAEHQSFFQADWVIYGDFQTRIHEIVRRGFEVSFDTTGPERVPVHATLTAMASVMPRPVRPEAAIQVLANSGITGIEARSTREDVIHGACN